MTDSDSGDSDGLRAEDFAQRFHELSATDQHRFVADLWAASGWTTTIDESVVTAVREDTSSEVRRIFVPGSNEDSASTPADMVIVDSDSEVSSQALELTPEDLYRRARYGLDRETANQLLETYFDRGIASGLSGADQDGQENKRMSPLRMWRHGGSVRAFAVGGVGGVLVAILIITAVISGGFVHMEFGDPNQSAIVSSADTPINRSVQDRSSDFRPTCNRPPSVVITIQLWALKYNNPETNSGIRSVWRFMSPANKQIWGSFSDFVSGMHRFPYSILLNHERAVVGPLQKSGSEIGQDEPLEEVSQTVITSSLTGNTSAFEFTLVKQENNEYAGCWMITSLKSLPVNKTDTELFG